MPVQHLPAASWPTALGLGFISWVFDNIPLTALAIRQDGYDWGFLAYAVGFGGSMIWFGSSAGVAISNIYPEARSVWAWLKAAWHIPVAYVVGFLTLAGFLLALLSLAALPLPLSLLVPGLLFLGAAFAYAWRHHHALSGYPVTVRLDSAGRWYWQKGEESEPVQLLGDSFGG